MQQLLAQKIKKEHTTCMGKIKGTMIYAIMDWNVLSSFSGYYGLKYYFFPSNNNYYIKNKL